MSNREVGDSDARAGRGRCVQLLAIVNPQLVAVAVKPGASSDLPPNRLQPIALGRGGIAHAEEEAREQVGSAPWASKDECPAGQPCNNPDQELVPENRREENNDQETAKDVRDTQHQPPKCGDPDTTLRRSDVDPGSKPVVG